MNLMDFETDLQGIETGLIENLDLLSRTEQEQTTEARRREENDIEEINRVRDEDIRRAQEAADQAAEQVRNRTTETVTTITIFAQSERERFESEAQTARDDIRRAQEAAIPVQTAQFPPAV